MICDQCETVVHCTKHGCVPKKPMPTKDEALKLALEAIANSGDFLFNWHDCEPNNEREMSRYQEVLAMNEKAFTALRTAIEQAEKQELVGYKPPAKWTDAEIKDGYRGIRWVTADGVYGRPTEEDVARYLGYTTPPAAIKQDLTPAQPAPMQEPVAQVVCDPDGSNKRVIFTSYKALYETPLGSYLYTTPPAAQRQWVEVEQVKWDGEKLIAKLKEKNNG